MSDQEFEKFLGENSEESGIDPVCHKRLLLEALQCKMNFISDMYESNTKICTEMKLDHLPVKDSERLVNNLFRLSKAGMDTLNQIDFFLTTLVCDIEKGEEDDGSKD